MDEFSRLTKGTILKDKSAQSVVNGIIDCWIFGYIAIYMCNILSYNCFVFRPRS